MKKTKLLIVSHCFPANSDDMTGNFLYDFSKHLKKLNTDITIFTPKMKVNYDFDYINKACDKFISFDWLGGKKRLAELKPYKPNDVLQLFSIFKSGKNKLQKLLKSENFDFILAVWIIPSGYYVKNIAKKQNIPFGLWALGSDINVYSKKPVLKNIVQDAYKKSTLAFVNSIALYNTVKTKFKISSLVLNTNRKMPIKKIIESKTKKFNLTFIGRLENVKGPDILLDAISLSKITNFSLSIIGGGSLEESLKNKAKFLNLSSKINFLGTLNSNEIANELSKTDYLVISSRSEGMPVVFWEAMQFKVPVIATDVGDIKYYCNRYNVGRVCSIDAKELADTINFLYNFKVLRPILSKNTEKISKIVSIENSAKQFLKTISRFVKN